jgi:hypothetical protein
MAVAGSSALAALLVLTGAGPAHANDGTPAPPGNPAGTSVSVTPPCDPLTRFRRSRFGDSARIDNRFFPLKPGTQFTLQGQSNMGGGLLPHTVMLTVTDLVKEINGVRTRVLWDRDINDGELVEAELAFHAQDQRGNVWSLGEYPEEFQGGVFVGAPNTWIAGVNGAKAGVLVPARPRLGTPAFLQGRAPDIGFFDCGQVFATDQDGICVPGACYDDVLVINEFNPLEPDSGIQRKFYAPHTGNIEITAVNDPEAETLVLTGVDQLSKAERRTATLEALRLEQRAYAISEVYQQTAPARPESRKKGT